MRRRTIRRPHRIRREKKRRRIIYVCCLPILSVVPFSAWRWWLAFDDPLPNIHKVPFNVTHSCRLARSDMSSNEYRSSAHIPHVLAWVAGCWSWLHGDQGSKSNSTIMSTATIALDSVVYSRFVIRPNYPKWNQAFFEGLQLPIVLIDDSESRLPIKHQEVYKRAFGELSWFGRRGPCDALRRRLWGHLGVAIRKSTAIRIGLVDRESRRRIVQASQLRDGLQSLFPAYNVSLRVFTSRSTLQEQAQWFAQQDLVILAHGAAVSNVLFQRPLTAVLELFPRNFCFNMFRSLAEQCDVHHFLYYDGGSHPEEDFQTHFSERGRMRNQDIHVSLETVQQRLLAILPLVGIEKGSDRKVMFDPYDCSSQVGRELEEKRVPQHAHTAVERKDGSHFRQMD
jgi:hypothetical protein